MSLYGRPGGLGGQRLHPADLNFKTLKSYFYGTAQSMDMVFGFDTSGISVGRGVRQVCRPDNRKHPGDLTFQVLKAYFLDNGWVSANWVFPIDTGEYRPESPHERAVREMRENARRIGLL
jgi:hypothetical protein